RRRHTRLQGDWSSDVCSSDLVQFVVYSRSATAMRLLLYGDVDDAEPEEIIEYNPRNDRWGDIWSIFVPGTSAGQLYHFQAEGPRSEERRVGKEWTCRGWR